MTKKEYDKITELLKKIKEYNDLCVGIINTSSCRISGMYSDGTNGYFCILDKEDREDLLDYFNKKLDDVSEQLKELGYYD